MGRPIIPTGFSPGWPHFGWQARISAYWRALIVAMLMLGSSLLVFRAEGAGFATLAYCAAGDDVTTRPLQVSLLQQQREAPVRLSSGETGMDGCGTFYPVPGDLPVMIVLWSNDGFSTGSTGWIDLDEAHRPIRITLGSQAAFLLG